MSTPPANTLSAEQLGVLPGLPQFLQVAQAAAPPLAVDVSDAQTFFEAVFPSIGMVSFRTLFEGGRSGQPSNHVYELGSAFPETLKGFLEWAALEQRSVFLAPGLCRPHRNGCKDDDIIGMPAIIADFDTGNPTDSLAAAEAFIGPASVVVESGGETEHGRKVHAWWKLAEVARGSDIAKVCAIQTEIAKRFNGDKHFGHPAQVIRCPSSWHRKKEPRIVKVRATRPTVYALAAVNAKLRVETSTPEKSNVVPFSLDFSRDAPTRNTGELRDMYVQTEGKSEVSRWEWFNLVAGAEIADVRAGRKTLDEALQYVIGKIQTHFERPEDWNEDRATREFNALVRVDLRNHGPIVASVPVMSSAPAEWSIDEWSIDRFKAPAPARRWLVEDLLPAGTAGIFAAAGDAGKSMMAVWLAYVVGCYPELNPAAALDMSAPRFFGQPITRRGAAVVLTAEDDADEVHRRIEKLDSSGLRKRGKQRVFVVPMPSAGGVRSIMEETPVGARPTPFWQALQVKLAAIPDLALVVIDPLSAFVDADVERNNRTGAALMTMLSEFATRTGATVILTHHVTKDAAPTGLQDGRGAIRGAGALVNNGRFALAMWEADQDGATKVLATLGQKDRARQSGIVFAGGLVKGNAPGSRHLRTLVRNAKTGLLEDVTDLVRAGSPRQGEGDEAVYAALRARKMVDPRFSFTKSKGPLEEAWKTALKGSGPKMSRDAREEQFWRLVARNLIVETEQPRGGHTVYEPKV